MIELRTMPLKFRVWDNYNKKFLQKEELRNFIIGYIITDDDEMYMTGRDFEISQNTGVLDSEEASIFTGDILQDDDEGYLSIVQYRDGEMVTVSLDGKQVLDSLSAAAPYSTVIGNVWSKPELLEEE